MIEMRSNQADSGDTTSGIEEYRLTRTRSYKITILSVINSKYYEYRRIKDVKVIECCANTFMERHIAPN